MVKCKLLQSHRTLHFGSFASTLCCKLNRSFQGQALAARGLPVALRTDQARERPPVALRPHGPFLQTLDRPLVTSKVESRNVCSHSSGSTKVQIFPKKICFGDFSPKHFQFQLQLNTKKIFTTKKYFLVVFSKSSSLPLDMSCVDDDVMRPLE